jgi:hypothetical protein
MFKIQADAKEAKKTLVTIEVKRLNNLKQKYQIDLSDNVSSLKTTLCDVTGIPATQYGNQQQHHHLATAVRSTHQLHSHAIVLTQNTKHKTQNTNKHTLTNRVKLIYAGKSLDDNESFAKQAVKAGALVHMILVMR